MAESLFVESEGAAGEELPNIFRLAYRLSIDVLRNVVDDSGISLHRD